MATKSISITAAGVFAVGTLAPNAGAIEIRVNDALVKNSAELTALVRRILTYAQENKTFLSEY